MRIDSVRLENFRNYEKLELFPDPGTNLFYGDNAQGKTNILEAVYVCGTTRSHRGGKDREMVRFGSEEAHIRLEVTKKDIPWRIDMHLKKNRAKGIAVNGVPIRRAAELLGICNFVFFSPEDLGIIKNGPAQRRRFLDMELCQLDPVYVNDLSTYNRILMQRGKLLRDLPFHPEYEDTIGVWDEQLVSCGSRIIRAREKFVRELCALTGPIHGRLSGGKEELEVVYEKNTAPENFAAGMKENAEKDRKLKLTHTGPHRDDLGLKVGGADLRRYGSQGQQRTAALALKLAEIELVKKRSGEGPVLLLDDVLSELDSGRQADLLDSIRDIQTLITGTGLDVFSGSGFHIDRLYHVAAGTLTQIGE